MTVAASLDPQVDAARRVAFTVARAEADLGLTETRLPIEDRLQAILSEAALRPADISPTSYAVVYLLAQKERQ